MVKRRSQPYGAVPVVKPTGTVFAFYVLPATRPTITKRRSEFRSPLLADDDYGEGAGLHFAAALAGSGRLEFGAGQKNLVCL